MPKAHTASASVQQCWEAWLASQNLRDGANRRPDGSILYTSSASFPVRAEPGSRAWVAARDAAFTQAELGARAELAGTIGVDLRSSREASVSKSGGDGSAPAPGPQGQPSNVERVNKLAGVALDDAIRQFEPGWNGGGLSEEEKRRRAVVLLNRADQEEAAQSRVYAAGAFTAVQCEGPESAENGGRYSVLTGLVQSRNLFRIAEVMASPGSAIPQLPPKAPVEEQFAQKSSQAPDWMAFTEGARVFADEHGVPVVVGFGAAAVSSEAAADRAQAHLHALAAIQRFVGEEVVATAHGSDSFADAETAGGGHQVFDSSSFQQRTAARAREIRLSGVHQVGQWRGTHPYGQIQMQVVALAWSPASAVAAAGLRDAMRPPVPAASAPLPARPSGPPGPAAAPVRQGASSGTDGL